MAVTTGAMRSRPPLRQAIVERPIIALPPMPPRKPEMTLPMPMAPTTMPGLCVVLVKSETTCTGLGFGSGVRVRGSGQG